MNFILIPIVIVIIYFLLCIFCLILGHFLNFIDDIFGITARKNNKKKFELSSDIGITTPNCPYCNVELPKFPGRKTKCKNCGNYIYVRTRTHDHIKVLLKESEINLISYKENNSIPIIDATKEMNSVCKYLTSHYLEYWNYDEILNIEEEDRLPIMKYIWEHWETRNVEKNLIKKYSQYDEEDIEFIVQRETNRVYIYYHWQEHKKEWGEIGTLVKIRLSSDWRTRLCNVKDEIDVFNYHIDEDAHICFTMMPSNWTSLETEYVYFWENGNYLKFTSSEFKKFCKKNNYVYPFRT